MLQDIFKLKSLFSSSASLMEQACEEGLEEATQSEESIFTPKGQSSQCCSATDELVKSGATPVSMSDVETIRIGDEECKVRLTQLPGGQFAFGYVYRADDLEMENPIGQLRRKLGADGEIEANSISLYDANGKVATQSDITFGSDGKIETQSISHYSNGVIAARQDRTFNSDEKVETESTSFYANGVITGKTDRTFNSDEKTETESNSYYRNGEIVQKAEYTFNSDEKTETELMSYYSNGEIVQQIDGTFTYLPDGTIETSSILTGKNGKIMERTDKTYNSDEQLEKESTLYYENNEIVAKDECIYTYDSDGNRLTESYLLWEGDELAAKEDCTYTYDSDGNRLTESSLLWENGEILQKDTTYAYGPDGDIEKISSLLYKNDEIAEETELRFNSDGRLQTGLILGYENGEVVGRAEQTFTDEGTLDSLFIYDREGELTYAFNPEDEDAESAAAEVSNESGYTTDFSGDIITVMDESGNVAAEINLDILLESFQKEDRGYITDEIGKMPPEALIDLYNENVPLGIFETHHYKHASAEADYHDDDDEIYMRQQGFRAQVFTHELGHAIDFVYESGPDEDLVNSPTSVRLEGDFSRIFNEEIEAMMKETGFSRETCIRLCYGAKKAEEAFAESYTLMMFPELGSTDVQYNLLQRYFPRTIAESEKMLGEIRELPQEQRGRIL